MASGALEMDPFETPAQALGLARVRPLSLRSDRAKAKGTRGLARSSLGESREMKRRKSPARRAALAALGMLPLVGACISIFWMRLAHATPQTLGRRAFSRGWSGA